MTLGATGSDCPVNNGLRLEMDLGGRVRGCNNRHRAARATTNSRTHIRSGVVMPISVSARASTVFAAAASLSRAFESASSSASMTRHSV